MLQNIIVFTIVLAALSYAVVASVKAIRGKKKSPCDDCAGCDLKNELRKNVSKDCASYHSKSGGSCH